MQKSRKKVSRGPGFTCVFCEKHFSGSTSQPIHIRRHIQEKPYDCRGCDFSATCITDVYLHERKVHSSGQYKCSACKKMYKNSISLKNHFRNQHSDLLCWQAQYKCPTCGKLFKIENTLTQHMRVHSKEKRYECDQCGDIFPIERELVAHKRMCSSFIPSPPGRKNPPQKVTAHKKVERGRKIRAPAVKKAQKETNVKIVKVYSLSTKKAIK